MSVSEMDICYCSVVRMQTWGIIGRSGPYSTRSVKARGCRFSPPFGKKPSTVRVRVGRLRQGGEGRGEVNRCGNSRTPLGEETCGIMLHQVRKKSFHISEGGK